MKNILHFGLQRSGTNFLETLLIKNFQINILNRNSNRNHPLQKHFRLYDDKSCIPEPQYNNDKTYSSFSNYEKSLGLRKCLDGILIISKDPYSWFISYLRWAKKCNWPKVNYHYIEEYNKFYGKWNEFSKEDQRIHFIRYIDFLINTKKELDIIQNKYNLNLSLRSKIFGKYIDSVRVNQSGNFTEEKKKFYTEKEYLFQINKTEIKIINSKLDIQLMNDLNYKIEKSV